MTNLNHYLIRVLLFVLVILVIASFLIMPISRAFMANAALNGMILAVFLIGLIFIVRKIALLSPEVTWISEYRSLKKPRLTKQRPPKLLAPVANMLGDRTNGKISLSATSLKSLLDSIDTRLSESRDTSRYLIGLLIFLGLLGTFWGLLETVGAVSDVIGDLSLKGGNLENAFADLKTGLEAPLSGMATAFSSSIFGLAGSLALGFLDLQLGQAQNRFYNDLEEWLSGLTKLSAGNNVTGDHEISGSAYQAALFEQTAESLDRLQRVMVQNEDGRDETNQHLLKINDSLHLIVDKLEAETQVIRDLSDNQIRINSAIGKLADFSQETSKDDYRHNLRNIDTQLSQLIKELKTGRDKSVEEIRQEIRLLARTIAVLAEEAD
ncbi:MAG: flagellar motor protein MotA [Thalassobaculaceae bacterium]